MTYENDIVRNIIESYGSTSVTVNEFFISWNAVPTLAYRGFSRTLLQIKADIDQRIPNMNPENPGSKWPKTTLGAPLINRHMEMKELISLRDLCEKINEKLHKLPSHELELQIDQLHIVTFQCRSLEKRLASYPIDLKGSRLPNDSPPDWHIEQVREVMNQFSKDQLDEYWHKVHPNGRTIEYYRESHFKTTLVFEVRFTKNVEKIVTKFIQKALPGYYSWFLPESRHMTVRALVSKPKQTK